MSCSRHSQSRGFALHESITAVVLASLVLLALSEFLGALTKHRQRSQFRAVAARELGNLMEEVAAVPFDDLVRDDFPETTFQTFTARVAPSLSTRDAQWSIEVAPGAGEDPGRRVTLGVTWKAADGATPPALRLHAWRYPERRE